MRVRVVCGLSDTIAILVPSILFISEDLPTPLSPAKETNNPNKYQNNEEIPIIFILHARSFFSIRLLF